MKKILISFIVVLMLAGCAGFQTQPAQNIALQIVAQRIGYYVGKNNPTLVPQAKLAAQGILASQTSDLAKAALQVGIDSLTKQFNDPLLASDVQLIVSGLGLNLPNVKIDLTQLTPIINAFVSGLDIGSK
jgi:hypothetical protein